MNNFEERPYTENTNAKTDHAFQATLGLNGKNRFVVLKQHWETRVLRIVFVFLNEMFG